MLGKFTFNSRDDLRQEETEKYIREKITMLTIRDLAYFDDILTLTTGTCIFTVLISCSRTELLSFL